MFLIVSVSPVGVDRVPHPVDQSSRRRARRRSASHIEFVSPAATTVSAADMVSASAVIPTPVRVATTASGEISAATVAAAVLTAARSASIRRDGGFGVD